MSVSSLGISHIDSDPKTPSTAFEGQTCIATGPLEQVARAAKRVFDRGSLQEILIFEDDTSCLIEVDFRGSEDQVVQRLASCGPDGGQPLIAEKRGPGRPKLGVVGREVTLLPRHWEWLDSQPGGASVALRRLVEAAKKANQGRDRVRRAQDAVYRFMSTMAGDLPGFEEALRAFYGADNERYQAIIELWPPDIRDHLKKLTAVAGGEAPRIVPATTR